MHQWYYRDPQSRKIGPLSDQEFEERIVEGEIQPKTRVWRSGLADWTSYEALLAHEASCQAEASGPAVSVGPQSSSYSTIGALGASATSRPPTGSCTATPSATPRGLPAPAFATCPDCGQQVAASLFREVDGRQICGFCVQKQAVKAKRDILCNAKGVDAHWFAKFILRCALIAGVFVFGRVIFFEVRHAFDGPSVLPTVEAPAKAPPGSYDPITGR